MGGVYNVPGLVEPVTQVNSFSFVPVVFLVVAILTECFQVVVCKANEWIADIVWCEIFLVVDYLGYIIATFANVVLRRKVTFPAFFPCPATIE